MTRIEQFQSTTRLVAAFSILFGPNGGGDAATLKVILSILNLCAFAIFLYAERRNKACGFWDNRTWDIIGCGLGLFVSAATNIVGLVCALKGNASTCNNDSGLGWFLIALNGMVVVAALLIAGSLFWKANTLKNLFNKSLCQSTELPAKEWCLRSEIRSQGSKGEVLACSCSKGHKAAVELRDIMYCDL